MFGATGTSEIPVAVDEEKHFTTDVHPESLNGCDVILDKRENDLSRSLKQRHIQMIALAGAIVSPQRLHLAAYVSCSTNGLLLC